MRRALPALAAVWALTAACSPTAWVMKRAADGVAGGGALFAAEDDPDLVREAMPSFLKGMEGLLERQPEHRGLLTALCRGYAVYAAAFVLPDAEREEDPSRAAAGKERARRLLLRARDYGVRGLSVDRPGFRDLLAADPRAAAATAGPEEVPLLYWTGASWGLAVSGAWDDPFLMADLPRVEALMRRALALDEGYESGSIHEFFVAFEGGRPEAMGGSKARAREHFEGALALSGGAKLSPRVTWAETVSVRRQDRKEFEEMLGQVLSFPAREEAPQHRLANLLAQRRARWLLGRADDLFLE